MTPEIAELYRGPLSEFIARRTAIAKELAATDAAAAASVRKLRKPSLAAWAIDQVAAQEPRHVAELLAAGADARDAQRAVAEGTASGDDLRAAVARLREAVEQAARSAESTLDSSGHTVGEATVRQIRDSLHAAATGGSHSRVALWRGTLDANLSPAGFGESTRGDPDPPELTKALSALRRGPAPTGRPSLRVVPPTGKKPSVDREAERLSAAARQARSTADAKRQQADRLAQAARLAEADAVAADEAAQSAEGALASYREGT